MQTERCKLRATCPGISFQKMDRDSEAFMPYVYSSSNLNLGQRGKGIGVRANHCDTTSTSYKIYFKEKEEKEIIE